MTMLNYDDSRLGRAAGKQAASVRPSPADLLDPAIPPDIHKDSFLRGYYQALSWEIAELSFERSTKMINEYRSAHGLPLLRQV